MSVESLIGVVRSGDLSDLVALVDGMTDTERRACVPELKELRKELRTEPWRSPAQRAYPALHAAGAACQTGAAAVAAWLTGSELRWRQAPPSVLIDMLGDRDPAWLADVVRRLAERPLSASVPYELMAGLVRLAGCPVPTSEAYVRGWMDHIGRARWEAGTVIGKLRQDPHLADLVAALFEIEEIGARSNWRYGDELNNWTYALTQLTREGVIDRKVMVDGCVARLLRGGGSTADNKVFLGLLTALDLTRDELRERIPDWMALCSDASSMVAAHAQAVLAGLALDGELGSRRLAEMSGAVLFRTEKKLVRAQLVLLGKVLKKEPSTAVDLLPAVAQAFGHEDTDVQERALKLVERHLGDLGDPGDPGDLCGPDDFHDLGDPDGLRERSGLGSGHGDASEVRGEIAEAAAQLSPGLRARAQRLLGPGAAESAPEAYEELLPPVPVPTRLAPAPETLAELTEEINALLASHDEGAVFERTLDGLVRHAHRDLEALVEAFGTTKARRWWDGLGPEALNQHFRNSPHDLALVVATLFERVDTDVLRPLREEALDSANCVHSGLLWAFDARLREIAYRIRTDPLPFLLSTPTWSTGSLEPEELVARLDAYRRSGARPGAADFAQALLRVRRDDTAALASAAAAARELGTREGDRLAEWLLTVIPSQPVARSRTAGPRILVEFGELPELGPEFFPPAFRLLGRPLSVYADRRHCTHWSDANWRHWLAMLPGRPEIVAGRVLRDLSVGAIDDARTGFSFLPALAEAEGEAGPAVRLCVAYGLGARHPEDRLAAVDALLVLAARGQLDAERLGTDLGKLAVLGSVKPLRLAEAIRTAAATGAYGTAWSVLRAALPPLLAELAGEGAAKTPPRGLGDLVAVAADCAERSGAHGELPYLAQTAERRGTSQLVTQARRLRTALTALTAGDRAPREEAVG